MLLFFIFISIHDIAKKAHADDIMRNNFVCEAAQGDGCISRFSSLVFRERFLPHIRGMSCTFFLMFSDFMKPQLSFHADYEIPN